MPELRRAGAPIYYEVSGSGPPLLLLHGFTGSGSALSGLVTPLSRDFTCVTVDLLGHGRSGAPEDAERYRLHELAEDALTAMDVLGLWEFGLFGYSLGGRVAMRLALTHPERIRCLALESSSPGIEDPGERQARREADDRLADEIGRRGIEWFADYWQSIPLFRSQAGLPGAMLEAERARRAKQSPLGLAMSLRGAGAGRDPDVWAQVRNLPRRLLLVAGTEDPKYLGIAERMASLHGDTRLERIEGAGHTVHLEAEDALLPILRNFFRDANDLQEGN